MTKHCVVCGRAFDSKTRGNTAILCGAVACDRQRKRSSNARQRTTPKWRAWRARYRRSDRGKAAQARAEAKRRGRRRHPLKVKTCVICGRQFNPHGRDRSCPLPECRARFKILNGREKAMRYYERFLRRERRRVTRAEKRVGNRRRNAIYSRTPKGRATKRRSAVIQHWRRNFGGVLPADVKMLLIEIWALREELRGTLLT